MSLEQALFGLCTAAEAALLVRLLVLRLCSRYIFFTLYLAADFVAAQVAFWFGKVVGLYGTLWAFMEPVLDVLLLLAAWEACRLVLRNYPGVGSFGKRVLFWIANAAAAVALISMLPDLAASLRWLDPAHNVAVLIKRALSTVALLAMFTVAVCTLWLPSPMPRNLRTHLRLLIAYLAVDGIGSAGVALDFFSSAGASTFMLATSALLFMSWVILLRRPGEAVLLPPATPADFEESSAIQAELDRLADTLKRPLG